MCSIHLVSLSLVVSESYIQQRKRKDDFAKVNLDFDPSPKLVIRVVVVDVVVQNAPVDDKHDLQTEEHPHPHFEASVIVDRRVCLFKLLENSN